MVAQLIFSINLCINFHIKDKDTLKMVSCQSWDKKKHLEYKNSHQGIKTSKYFLFIYLHFNPQFPLPPILPCPLPIPYPHPTIYPTMVRPSVGDPHNLSQHFWEGLGAPPCIWAELYPSIASGLLNSISALGMDTDFILWFPIAWPVQ